jgi:hypothetical protein
MTVEGFDPEGMNALAVSLRRAQHSVYEDSEVLYGLLTRLGLPTDSARVLTSVSLQLGTRQTEAERRRDLGRAASAVVPLHVAAPAVSVPDAQVWLFPDPSDADVAAQSMVDDLRAYLSGESGSAPPAALADQFAQATGDPYFARALTSRLSPAELASIPLKLAERYTSFERGSGSLDDFRLRQQTIVRALGTSLAIATRQEGGLPGASDALLARISEPGFAYGVSNLLRYGTYDTAFLARMGAGIASSRGAWGSFQPHSIGYYGVDLGLTDADYGDPLTGYLDALGHNAVAAQEFLTDERLPGLLTERPFMDDGAAMGRALVAATTTFRDHDPDVAGKPSPGHRSAEIASQSIHLLGQRGDYPPGFRVPVAKIVAAYMPDFDRVIQGGDRGVPGTVDVAVSDHGFPLPWGARFTLGDLASALKQAFREKRSFEVVSASLTQFTINNFDSSANRIVQYLEDHPPAPGTDPTEALKQAMNSTAGGAFNSDAGNAALAFGFLANAWGDSEADRGAAEDEKAEAFSNLAGGPRTSWRCRARRLFYWR